MTAVERRQARNACIQAEWDLEFAAWVLVEIHGWPEEKAEAAVEEAWEEIHPPEATRP